MALWYKTIKQGETFPKIPLPHTHIVVIYSEFKNSDPLFMSQVGALFVTFLPKSFKFQICIFKAFIYVGTSQFFYILQACHQKKEKNPYGLNLGPRSLSFQHLCECSRNGVVVFHHLQQGFKHYELREYILLSFPKWLLYCTTVLDVEESPLSLHYAVVSLTCQEIGCF